MTTRAVGGGRPGPGLQREGEGTGDPKGGQVEERSTAVLSEQSAATREIARGAEIASKSTAQSAGEVAQIRDATTSTRSNAATVKTVAGTLGALAARIRGQVDGLSDRLRSA